VKTCVFVDGENFRYSIVNLFSQFHQEDYLPKSANWTEFFDWIVKNVTENVGERIRTYWYVIKSVDYFPYSFPDPIKSKDDLQKLLSKHEPYKQELDKLDDPSRLTRMTKLVEVLQESRKNFQKRFDGWITIQDGISLRHKAIEFRRAGYINYNLFTNTLGPEKAVDVKLAADLITLSDIYDVAIIVTGDQDYVPAVEVVKDCGKRIVNVAFKTRGGDLLPGGARRLNLITDWHYDIAYLDLANQLRLAQLPLKTQ
jgi:hypothetical protein